MAYFRKQDKTTFVKCIYLLTTVIGPSVVTSIALETKLRREEEVPSGPGTSLGSTIETACDNSC